MINLCLYWPTFRFVWGGKMNRNIWKKQTYIGELRLPRVDLIQKVLRKWLLSVPVLFYTLTNGKILVLESSQGLPSRLIQSNEIWVDVIGGENQFLPNCPFSHWLSFSWVKLFSFSVTGLSSDAFTEVISSVFHSFEMEPKFWGKTQR